MSASQQMQQTTTYIPASEWNELVRLLTTDFERRMRTEHGKRSLCGGRHSAFWNGLMGVRRPTIREIYAIVNITDLLAL